jgi:hypothetical protein
VLLGLEILLAGVLNLVANLYVPPPFALSHF